MYQYTSILSKIKYRFELYTTIHLYWYITDSAFFPWAFIIVEKYDSGYEYYNATRISEDYYTYDLQRMTYLSMLFVQIQLSSKCSQKQCGDYIGS